MTQKQPGELLTRLKRPIVGSPGFTTNERSSPVEAQRADTSGWSSIGSILALQRAMGNAAVSRLLLRQEPNQSRLPPDGHVVRRFPIPDQTRLETDAGYAGGKHRKKTWGKLTIALNAYHQDKSLANVNALRLASEAARQTFDQPDKRKKVGEATAKQIQATLTRLETDCRIEVMVQGLKQDLQAHDLGPRIAELSARVLSIESLLAGTVDQGGQLQAYCVQVKVQLERAREGLYRAQLEAFLTEQGYRRDRNFLVAPARGLLAYDLPHVDWKAHIGATRDTALAVVQQAIPILEKLGFQHKVDVNPGVFQGTNKLITIYPPKDPASWPTLIAALEKQLGGLLTEVPGELPVGETGRVGMRHGQITALNDRTLEQATNTQIERGKYFYNSNLGDMKMDVVEAITPAKEGAKVPTIDDSLLPGGKLCVGADHVLYFVVPRGMKTAPAILYEGKIVPDPRSQPNPYNQTLPTGVKERGK